MYNGLSQVYCINPEGRIQFRLSIQSVNLMINTVTARLVWPGLISSFHFYFNNLSLYESLDGGGGGLLFTIH